MVNGSGSGNSETPQTPETPETPAAGGSFTIAASVSGEGGTVTIKKNGVAVEGDSVQATGSDTVVIEAVPENDNFQFMSWSDGSSQNPHSFQPRFDNVIDANFLDLSKI